MTKKIGIVGAGTAGLHLGLYLRQHDVDVTLFSERDPDAYVGARLQNTVAHHAVTIEREEALRVNHWPDGGYYGHHYYFGVKPQPIRFYGDLHAPSRAVDYRIYHPKLMADFAARGGKLVIAALRHQDVTRLSKQFDLMVICTGKGPFGRMFEIDPAHSTLDRPKRALCVGIFKGIRQREKRAVTMYFSPGAGEMIEIPTLTFNGMQSALVIENQIGGDLEVLARTKYEDDPRAFLDLLLRKLRAHYPDCAERIDEKEFDLANGPLDILQGGVTPTVRKSSVRLDPKTLAISLGDVQATVDPLLGQGANLASHSAWILGEEILSHDVLDERFVEHVDHRRNDRVLAANRWTNTILDSLKTMPAAFVECVEQMAKRRELADEFTDNFNYPERQWDCFASEQRMTAWWQKRTAGKVLPVPEQARDRMKSKAA